MEETRPFSISVVIPVYNMAHHLFRLVCSVVWQLAPEDEIIIVDDGSTDLDGPGPIEPFLPRLTWLQNPVNKGLAYSRNRAIRQARSEWIKFLDADDVLAPFALGAVRQEIPESIQVVTGGCHRVFEGQYADFLTGAEESLKAIRHINPMLPSATFVRRKAMLEVGLFDERMDFEEDWDLWFKLHERYGPECFRVTPQPICFYWSHQAERAQKNRTMMVEGIPVREYFRRRYGADPG